MAFDELFSFHGCLGYFADAWIVIFDKVNSRKA